MVHVVQPQSPYKIAPPLHRAHVHGVAYPVHLERLAARVNRKGLVQPVVSFVMV